MVGHVEVFMCPGHISREHFLDLIESDGHACDLDDIVCTYCVPFITYEGSLYPVGPPEAVTVVVQSQVGDGGRRESEKGAG
jgi:hypothetical protein